MAGENAKKAETEALWARKAQREAADFAKAEAAAKALAQNETHRANAERERAKEQLTRAEWLVYSGKLMLALNDFEAGDGRLALQYLNASQPNLRGWEYRHLSTRINAKLTFGGGGGEVNSVAFSPDGKRLVTGSWDKTAMVWNAETGREVLTLKGHTGVVWSAAFSPDGQRIVTGSEDTTAKVWDAATGREILTIRGNAVPVYGVAFSPDGKRIVAGRPASEDPRLRVWDAATGQEVLTLKGHTSKGITSHVSSVAFSPDGKRIASAGGDSTKFWDAETGQELFALHGGSALSVAFSPDGRRVVTGSHGKSAKVWDTETGQELLAVKGHLQGAVNSVAFSPDGRRIGGGGWDGTTKVWDAETGQKILALEGRLGDVSSVAFSPDGKRLATGISAGATVKMWDAGTRQQLFDLKEHTGRVLAVAFSPDGQRMVTGGGPLKAPGEGKVWDAATGQQLLDLKGHTNSVSGVAFSPDGKRIVSGSQDKTAKVWDAATGRQLLDLKGHTAWVQSVAFSPDGKRIVSGSQDKTAKVWDAASGQQLLDLKGHAHYVKSVAFSPDGKHIVSGSWDRTAKMWDAQTGQELFALKGHTSAVLSVAFSSDGKRLLSGGADTTVRVWDARRGQELLTLTGHGSQVECVAFSPDGKRLASGSLDGTVRLWDTATDRAPWPLPDAAQRKRYHTEQATLAMQQKQWFAAEFHLRRVLRDDPKNTAVKTRLAQMTYVSAYDQRKFAFATRLWAEALASDLKLGDDPLTQARYHAARAAAMAAAGPGKDEPPLDEKALAKLRRQALDWLKAELTALDRLPQADWPATPPTHWRTDSALAGIRDGAALAKLPPAEQAQWQALWAEVEAFASFVEHFNRGSALARQGKHDEAGAEYRATIRRNPNFAEAYCRLGAILSRQGDFAGSLEMMRKGHELGLRRPNWSLPSAQWVAQAERALALSKRLPALLRGEDKPADNAERLAFAEIAYVRKNFAAATRLWAQALTGDPKLADDRRAQHRYNAACAAALAATGQGKDEPPLDDAAKAKWRRQALDWLKSDLTAWHKLVDSGPPQARPTIVQTLSHWQKDSDLAGIRDAAALAKLPVAEQKAFTQMWTDVAELLNKAQTPPKVNPIPPAASP